MSSKGGPEQCLECCQVASVYFVASMFHIRRRCVCPNADLEPFLDDSSAWRSQRLILSKYICLTEDTPVNFTSLLRSGCYE